MHYALLVGVHGVGKTTLLNNLRDDIQFTALSISDLIRQAGNEIRLNNKFTGNIANNQELWKQELATYPFQKDEIVILDGHFTLLDSLGQIIELPYSTFDGLKINRIILKIEDPSIIQKRLMKRDNNHWDKDLIDSFQAKEQRRVIEFAQLEKIPLFLYDNDSKLEELKQFLL
ncbi:ATP-binding protein [Streptococcus intermedius]|uniref:ATP-binding protein n=1 Tax=Streptococcus intermedius TaxID=1338 RepID=UPI000F672B51|nr:ATP-binding protein [Streptococcus intermedius]MCB5001772.1 AAA family ATPase [Streptococcus mutans]MCB5091565.1 AAA family ATPase [Streptococcus mutans]RSJ12319.1 adenylate kinase [Streptococcus intermedius]